MKKIFFLLVISLFLSGCMQGDIDKVSTNGGNQGELEISSENISEDKLDEDKIEEGEEQEVVKDTKNNNDKYISAEGAFDIYKEKYPNAKINEIEFNYYHNRYEYEIEGYEGRTEYEINIDATTGEIIDEEDSRVGEQYGDFSREKLNKINDYIDQSLIDAGKDYWMKQWELKAKRDYVKFVVELRNDSGKKKEYKYNYDTGELLKKSR